MAESSVPLVFPSPQTEDDDCLADMTIWEASEIFLESRRPFIAHNTYRGYAYDRKRLAKYFGQKKLRDYTGLDIRKFQQHYVERGIGSSDINQLTSLIRQILKRAGLWEKAGRGFQPLPPKKDSLGRCLTDEEETRLLKAAILSRRWEDCYLFILISLNTSMGPGECQHLRRRDIDLEKRTVNVNAMAAKNSFRVRTIPLNDVAFGACQEALARAEKKGSIAPDDFVFPFRILGNPYGGKYDPTRPATTFKTVWKEIIKAAQLPKLRQYDLRHTCLTRLCENPENSEEVIRTIAGHCSPSMMKRYSHVRVEARRAALGRLLPVRSVQRLNMPSPERNRTGKPLTNRDVMELIEVGLPAKIVAEKIDKSAGAFDTSPQILKELKKAGVHDSIILAMVRAS